MWLTGGKMPIDVLKSAAPITLRFKRNRKRLEEKFMGKKSIFTITLITAGLLSAQSLQEVQNAVNDFAAAAAVNHTAPDGSRVSIGAQYSANRLPGARSCSATMILGLVAHSGNVFVRSDQWEIDLDQKGGRLTARVVGDALTITTPASGIKIRRTVYQGASNTPTVTQVTSLTVRGNGYAAKALELGLKAMGPNQAAVRYCQSQKG
jgi:hypothetical protein